MWFGLSRSSNSKKSIKINCDSHLQATVAAVLSAAAKVEASVGVVVDVTMAEKQRSHHGCFVVAVDQLLDDHLEESSCLAPVYLKTFPTNLLDDAISDARQIFLVQIHENDARLEAPSQVQQRVE